MKKRYLRRLTLAMTMIMTGFFGFPGLVLADAGISNTGPDSYNKIQFKDESNCDVENNNNVDVNNVNFQNAQTGDAVVGGSSWEKYSPEVWQARGHSYEEWQSAVNSYMSEHEGEWRENWGHGGGNTTGGDATSGDAKNVNNTKTNVSIENGDACEHEACCDERGNPVKPGQKPTHDRNGHVLGDEDHEFGGAGVGGHVLGAGAGGASGVGGQGGVGGAFHPSVSGGAGGGADHKAGVNGHDEECCPSFEASINETGPDSYNKISYKDESNVSVQNNNSVSVENVSVQSASSGDATVSGNTTGGSGGSGGAYNANGTGTGAGISN